MKDRHTEIRVLEILKVKGVNISPMFLLMKCLNYVYNFDRLCKDDTDYDSGIESTTFVNLTIVSCVSDQQYQVYKHRGV